MNNEINIDNRKVIVTSIKPKDVVNVQNKENFVKSIEVFYVVEYPDVFDGDGNPTTLRLGVTEIINVEDYKNNEFINFEDISQDYFYDIAKEYAKTSDKIKKQIIHLAKIDEIKQTGKQINPNNKTQSQIDTSFFRKN